MAAAIEALKLLNYLLPYEPAFLRQQRCARHLRQFSLRAARTHNCKDHAASRQRRIALAADPGGSASGEVLGQGPCTRSIYDTSLKYYSGGSFPGWFWHYAPWGFLITAIIFVAIGLILFRPERDHTDDRYVRGTHVVPQRRLRHKLHGTASSSAAFVSSGCWSLSTSCSLAHPAQASQPQSGACCGRSRCAARPARCSTRSVSTPPSSSGPRGDLILSPLDARCSSWSPWWELKPGSEAIDAEALAAALTPDPSNMYGQSGDDFFCGNRHER